MTRLDERGFEVEYKSIASFWKPTEPRGLRIEWQESGGGAKTISSGREARPLLVKLSEDATKAKSKQVSNTLRLKENIKEDHKIPHV